MDELPIKFTEKPRKGSKFLPKLLKNLRIIERYDDLEDLILTNIKIPLFDYFYDFFIKLFLFFVLLISFYFPPPSPLSQSLLLLLFKAIALTVAYKLIIKLKHELWEK